MTRTGMRAVPGDRLLIDGDPRRRRSGHIALVSPDSYSSLVPAGCELAPSREDGVAS